MTLGELLAVLARRWYLMLPLTLAGLLAGGWLYTTVPVQYTSQSSISLLDSTAVARLAPTYGNPLSNAGGSLVVTADVLIKTLQSSDAASDLRKRGVGDPYTVGFAAGASGPLVSFAVTGTDRAHVLAETRRLTDFAQEQLQALQAASQVAPQYYVKAAPIVLPQTPVSQQKSRYQYVAAVVIACTTAGFLLSFVVESWSRARRRRRGLPARADRARPAVRWTRQRALLRRPLDAATILTGYLLLAFFVPSNMALPALGGAGTPANVFALLGLFWYVASWLTGRIAPAAGTRGPRLAMCVLAGAVLMSYVADATRAGSHEEVLGADRGLILLLVWVALVVLASAGISDRDRLDTLLRRVVVMATVVAAIGYYDFFARTNIADSISIPGLHTSVAGIEAMDRGDFVRPRSTTAHPLEFGGMLAILLPFAIQQAFDPVRREAAWIRRWGPVAVMGGALPLTVSRTSIIGIALVALVMVPRWKPQRRWAALGLMGASVAVFKVLVPGLIGTITTLFSTFLSNSDSSTQARTVKYSAIVPYLRERPLFGRGFGTFSPDLYFFTDNQYMLTAAEMGALGLVALAVLFFTGIHHGGAIRRLARTESDRELGQAFFASSVVALVISATFDALSFPMYAGMFFLVLGAGGSCLGFLHRPQPSPPGGADGSAPRSPAAAAPAARTDLVESR